MRPFDRDVYRLLTKAVQLGYERVGGIVAFADRTRPKVATLSKYASESDDNGLTIMPIDVAIDLDKAAGAPIVTARMADVLGYDLVPKIAGMGAGLLTETDALDVMTEAMDFVRSIRAALADGSICDADRAALQRDWHDLRREMDEAVLNAGVLATC